MKNLKKLFPIIVYINLDSREDRRIESEIEFEKLNIDPIRISGTSIQGTSNSMINGMLGCTLSHLRCLLLAKKENKNILIFEDDIKFINDYENIVEGACNDIQSIDWQMLYLGGNILKPFAQISDNLAKLSHCQSTHAYGINVQYVDLLITYILLNQTMNHGYVRPLDTIYADVVIPRHNCFIVAPEMVAVQRDSYSDIEMKVADYESYLEKRYHQNFVRKPIK